MSKSPIQIAVLAFLVAAGACPAADSPHVSAWLTIDREHIYQWEPFTITLTVRSAGIRLQFESISEMADKGQIEMLGENFEELAPKRSVVNRVTHTIRRFRRRARATTAGKITLAPVVYARRIERKRSFFGWTESRVSYPFRANAVPIEVQPIPHAGRPDSFSGAVGRLSFDVELAPTELAVGDLVTATIRIEGDGYLDRMKPPALSPGRHFKAYELKEKESTPRKRVFEQIVVPQNSNAVQVAAVSFCFFNTEARQYETVTRGPFPLKFRAPAEQVADVPYVRPTNAIPSAPVTERPVPAIPQPSLRGVERYRTLVRALSFSLICAIAVGLWLILRVRRSGIVTLLGVVLALQAVALFYAVRYGVMARPVRSVAEATSARLAPAAGALVTFEVPKGAVVHLHASHGTWRKIDFQSKRGWVSADALVSGPGTTR